jgi:hypothetical protein
MIPTPIVAKLEQLAHLFFIIYNHSMFLPVASEREEKGTIYRTLIMFWALYVY